jgi:hypothetical protein
MSLSNMSGAEIVRWERLPKAPFGPLGGGQSDLGRSRSTGRSLRGIAVRTEPGPAVRVRPPGPRRSPAWPFLSLGEACPSPELLKPALVAQNAP